MKPSRFAYVRAESKEHALAVLAEHGDDAKVLAGGQSLGPLLNMRLATPAVLVDINGLNDLSFLRPGGGGSMLVGALSRHRALETDKDLAARWPLFADAVPFIGHRAIRNRGTIGGSLVHADPAAELPAVIAALEARIVLESRRGARDVAAEDFFESFYTCVAEPDELVTEVVLPAPEGSQGSSWAEFAPRHGDYGYVGVAAVVTMDQTGVCRSARIVYSGVDSTPMVSSCASAALGSRLDEQTLESVALEAARSVRPAGDLSAPSGYKKRLVYQLTRSALGAAARRAGY